mmetsp:Transcript_21164/g.24426  ORF Transcript_21164/g.24426 Transcript_21164/m.24426 type:complete len:95 (+) Transcript_21164:878-1162(+)
MVHTTTEPVTIMILTATDWKKEERWSNRKKNFQFEFRGVDTTQHKRETHERNHCHNHSLWPDNAHPLIPFHSCGPTIPTQSSSLPVESSKYRSR